VCSSEFACFITGPVRGNDENPVRHFLRVSDLQTLRPGQWLNDEVVNANLACLERQSEGFIAAGVENSIQPLVPFTAVNSLIWQRLTRFSAKKIEPCDLHNTRRWAKNISENILSNGIILMPINRDNVH
jgi:Ulp1 family protease